MKLLTNELLQVFRSIYGYNEGVVIHKAPGRINLIGGHTDYNDGYVLPTPIDRYIWVAAAPRRDSKIRIHAINFNDSIQFNVGSIKYNQQHKWANYLIGVVNVLKDNGFTLEGADIVITGNVPLGAGLGSSAALEVASIRAFQAINQIEIDPVEAAYIGKQAENEFVGVHCGIMDQFVSSLGEHGRALFIDCRTNYHKLIDLCPDYVLLIVNTMKNRELTDSDYNVRKSQCVEAVKLLQCYDSDIKALRDVNPDLLTKYWSKLPDDIRKRARHVVTENKRVLEAMESICEGKAEEFGDLMYDSHESLRYDYDVSCRELDVLVDATLDMKCVAGARMTGAGFGGCTVNLVRKEYVDKFVEKIKDLYFRKTAKNAEVYLV